MTINKWMYFSRGGYDVFEIFRLPFQTEKITMSDLIRMERAKQDGTWSSDEKDQALFDEMKSGWFDYQDEISEEKAFEYLAKWRATNWPGR
jgi:hypothetical protein